MVKRPIEGTDRFVPKPGVIPTDLENEVVLLDPETRLMFSLNATGRFVWQRLEAHSVTDLARALAEEFDVSAGQALSDVQMLLRELLEAGLASARSDDGQR